MRRSLLVFLVAVGLGAGCPNGPTNKPDSGPGFVLKPCDLVISEFMADPHEGSSGYEWIEIFNNSGKDLASVAGLTIEIWTTRTPGKDTTANYRHTLTAGKAPALKDKGYLVVYSGKGPDGGTALSGYYWSGLTLRNSSAIIILKTGNTVVHQVEYGKSTVQAGKIKKAFSRQLSSNLLGSAKVNCTTAKSVGSWCEGNDKYDAKNTGTPGKISDCKGTPLDGGPGDGPQSCNLKAGDVLLTELLTDPNSSDFKDEWLELYNNTTAPINMACLQVIINSKYTCKPTGTLKAGGFFIVHHGGAGAPAGFSCTTLSLSNDYAVVEVKSAAITLHKISYGKKPDGGVTPVIAKPKSGVAKQLDGQLITSSRINPAVTQVGANWCDAAKVYDTKNKGTPATKNTNCAGAPADGGADAATNCGVAAGDLLITEIQSNTKDSYMNEWLELYNNSGKDLPDLSCVTVAMNTNTCKLSGSLKKGAFLALHRGKAGSPAGGKTCSGLSLNNTYAVLEIRGYKGLSIHKLGYGKAPDAGASAFLLPAPQSGVAKQLSKKLFTGAKITTASTYKVASWCDATSSWGTGGNKGTPGVANINCP